MDRVGFMRDQTVVCVSYCLSGVVASCKTGGFHLEGEETTLSNHKCGLEIGRGRFILFFRHPGVCWPSTQFAVMMCCAWIQVFLGHSCFPASCFFYTTRGGCINDTAPITVVYPWDTLAVWATGWP